MLGLNGLIKQQNMSVNSETREPKDSQGRGEGIYNIGLRKYSKFTLKTFCWSWHKSTHKMSVSVQKRKIWLWAVCHNSHRFKCAVMQESLPLRSPTIWDTNQSAHLQRILKFFGLQVVSQHLTERDCQGADQTVLMSRLVWAYVFCIQQQT